jgi:hypothetical protein
MSESLFFDCPHCQMILKKNATFCPQCGSDAKTGWSEYAAFELPYEKYDPKNSLRQSIMQIIALFTAFVLLIVYI